MTFLGTLDLTLPYQAYHEAGGPSEEVVEGLLEPVKQAGHKLDDVAVRFCNSRHAGQLPRLGTDRNQAYASGRPAPLSLFPETNTRDWTRFTRHGIQPNQGIYVSQLSKGHAVPVLREMARHRAGTCDVLMAVYRREDLNFRFPLEPDFALFRTPPAEALLGFLAITLSQPLLQQQQIERDELESRMHRLKDHPEIRVQTWVILRALRDPHAKDALLELVGKVDRHIEIRDYAFFISTLFDYRHKIKNLDEIVISANSEMSAKKNRASYFLELNTFRLFCNVPGLEEIRWGTMIQGQEYDLILTIHGQKIIAEVKQSHNVSSRKNDQRRRLLDYAQTENAKLVYIYGARHNGDPPLTTWDDLALAIATAPEDTLNFLAQIQEK
jgi:hypothetical protein